MTCFFARFSQKRSISFCFCRRWQNSPFIVRECTWRHRTQWWKNTCSVSSCCWHGLPTLQLLAELPALCPGKAGLDPWWGLCHSPWNRISRSNWLYCWEIVHKIRKLRVNRKLRQNSSLQRVMYIWNELLRNVIEAKCTNEFKKLPVLFLDVVEEGGGMEEASRKVRCILERQACT